MGCWVYSFLFKGLVFRLFVQGLPSNDPPNKMNSHKGPYETLEGRASFTFLLVLWFKVFFLNVCIPAAGNHFFRR